MRYTYGIVASLFFIIFAYFFVVFVGVLNGDLHPIELLFAVIILVVGAIGAVFYTIKEVYSDG